MTMLMLRGVFDPGHLGALSKDSTRKAAAHPEPRDPIGWAAYGGRCARTSPDLPAFSLPAFLFVDISSGEN